MNNCCETRETFPKNITMRSFVYVDGKYRESARFLRKHEVKKLMPTIIQEYIANDNYLITFVDVAKSEVDKFFDAMRDMENSMILLGYKDYDAVCEEFFGIVAKISGSLMKDN